MYRESPRTNYGKIGKTTGWATFLLGIVYVLTTILGFLSLNSSNDPIGDPYFTIMELLTILIAPLMAVSMVTVHYYAAPEDKTYSLAALVLMFIMAGITSSVHFVILTVSKYFETLDAKVFALFFTFEWPSVVYSLDILAWDWFFALSLLFAATVFKVGRLAKILRKLMIVCGFLSLCGLLGVVVEDMHVRNIGIIGYAVIAPFVFLLIGIVVGGTKQVNESVNLS